MCHVGLLTVKVLQGAPKSEDASRKGPNGTSTAFATGWADENSKSRPLLSHPRFRNCQGQGAKKQHTGRAAVHHAKPLPYAIHQMGTDCQAAASPIAFAVVGIGANRTMPHLSHKMHAVVKSDMALSNSPEAKSYQGIAAAQ